MRPGMRDLRAAGLLIGGLGLLVYFLWHYVSKLSHPLPMMGSFGLLLAIACYYEVRAGLSRHTLALVTVQVWLFVFAALFAPFLRDLLVETLQAFAATPELVELSGQEYASALHNPVLGYGSCFALGLALLRVFFTEAVKHVLFGWSLEESDLPQPCPYCGSCRK